MARIQSSSARNSDRAGPSDHSKSMGLSVRDPLPTRGCTTWRASAQPPGRVLPRFLCLTRALDHASSLLLHARVGVPSVQVLCASPVQTVQTEEVLRDMFGRLCGQPMADRRRRLIGLRLYVFCSASACRGMVKASNSVFRRLSMSPASVSSRSGGSAVATPAAARVKSILFRNERGEDKRCHSRRIEYVVSASGGLSHSRHYPVAVAARAAPSADKSFSGDRACAQIAFALRGPR